MNDEMEPDVAGTAQAIALSRRLRWSCYAIRAVAAIWLAFDAAASLWNWTDRARMREILSALYGLEPARVSDAGIMGAAAMTVVSVAAAAIFVVAVWRLAGVYLEGRVFTPEAADRMRGVALAGFGATLTDMIVRPIGAAMLASELLRKAPLYNWFNPNDLLYLLVSGFVLALAAIFRAAAKIAADHARIV